jgi:hypothetical protein
MSSALVKRYVEKLNLTVSDDVLQRIASSLEDIRANQLQTLPMVCQESDCVFAQTCPLQKEGVAPKGSLCPIEKMLIDEWTSLYAFSLGVDSQDFVELSMLADIIEAEVYDRRTSGDISMNQLFEMQAVGVDNHGDPILRKEPAVALAVKMMMKKRKDDIRRAFLATRETRAKYKQLESEDITTQFSRIREEVEAMRKELPAPREDLDFEDASVHASDAGKTEETSDKQVHAAEGEDPFGYTGPVEEVVP